MFELGFSGYCSSHVDFIFHPSKLKYFSKALHEHALSSYFVSVFETLTDFFRPKKSWFTAGEIRQTFTTFHLLSTKDFSVIINNGAPAIVVVKDITFHPLIDVLFCRDLAWFTDNIFVRHRDLS